MCQDSLRSGVPAAPCRDRNEQALPAHVLDVAREVRAGKGFDERGELDVDRRRTRRKREKRDAQLQSPFDPAVERLGDARRLRDVDLAEPLRKSGVAQTRPDPPRNVLNPCPSAPASRCAAAHARRCGPRMARAEQEWRVVPCLHAHHIYPAVLRRALSGRLSGRPPRGRPQDGGMRHAHKNDVERDAARDVRKATRARSRPGARYAWYAYAARAARFAHARFADVRIRRAVRGARSAAAAQLARSRGTCAKRNAPDADPASGAPPPGPGC